LKKDKEMKRRTVFLDQRIERILLVFIVLFWTSLVQSESLLKIPLYINGKEFWVEVAKTPEERAKGLMGKKTKR
jgi:uncharacterized membrane protein